MGFPLAVTIIGFLACLAYVAGRLFEHLDRGHLRRETIQLGAELSALREIVALDRRKLSALIIDTEKKGDPSASVGVLLSRMDDLEKRMGRVELSGIASQTVGHGG